ncbi:MAG: DEAD/DEAH box helicase [Chloroflexi bacterium]|nr:DEAD/DEAH box helicase [Chloroflexota bacterium]
MTAESETNVEKGYTFERVVKNFLQQDKALSAQYDEVWLWPEWEGNQNQHDIGIDLVARERHSGEYVAIQCKCYRPGSSIDRQQVNKFLGAYAVQTFSKGIFVSTSDKWTSNAEAALVNLDKPVTRWGPDVFENSSIDWSKFTLDHPDELPSKPPKELRAYQKKALTDVVEGFKERDRGKLIMACGSGKTFTALHIAERMAGAGGSVLFLTPSLSLLSQALNDWTGDTQMPMTAIPVCSDAKIKSRQSKASEDSEDSEDISMHDLKWPASTRPEDLLRRFQRAKRGAGLTVVFSTYQSLDVVAKAQDEGLPAFDLIICDEAHRTTGASGLTEDDESNFQRVHDNDFIDAAKRLYMTATPRIYGDQARRKASENKLLLASMDDEKIYGPEFHRLGFGKAVEMGILSDYKVVILNVDLEEVGEILDKPLSDNSIEINMDNGARMVGSWNGLGKRDVEGVDFSDDPLPAKRAVAFSNTIKQSKEIRDYFPLVIDECVKASSQSTAGTPLQCDVRHVDGTQNALKRAEELAWLRDETSDSTCKILTNARCLTEGIDVPALDAILFMHPRKSEIDVVQAVGRVMRKSPGKVRGYIILPIAPAPGADPKETISESAYKAVWQVINAIAAHDDRFEARINQLKLTADTAAEDYTRRRDIGSGSGEDDETEDSVPTQLPLEISGSAQYRDAILAMLVDKYSSPRYWETWADKVREIARRHEARIRALLRLPDSGIGPVFDRFLTELRGNLNDGISQEDAVSMLSQHLVAKPVFDALFADFDFAERNPVSKAMGGVIEALAQRGLEKETESLEDFYRDVRISAEGFDSAAEKQHLVAQLYERFFKGALPDDVFKSLGIAYTPVEVVDYIVRSVEDLLNSEFDASLGDQGVHIIDPFVGTGTFITRLLQSGIIKAEDLQRKYAEEIHANEINLLAYYIAAINIEAVYHEKAQAAEYRPFEGIVLTDTFQAYESSAPQDDIWFPENNQRIARQKQLDIRVVIGNPPWSATNNRAYPSVDGRVKEMYGRASTTSLLNSLYDPYVKAIRLASDWIQDGDNGGIVAFVTNGGFIDSNSFDGFRKAVADEFDVIYCYNLRGNARTSGERRRAEGGGVFGESARAGVAILFLVKRYPPSPPDATIRIKYRDIGDYLAREAKLACLQKSRLAQTDWEAIGPTAHQDWINQRSDIFPKLRPLGVADSKSDVPIFVLQTMGLTTSRDAWSFNSSTRKLRANIRRSVDSYNREVTAFQDCDPTGNTSAIVRRARAFVTKDEKQFHWDVKNYKDLASGVIYSVNESGFRIAAYRPFFKQRLYFDRSLMNRIRRFPDMYPNLGAKNLGIAIVREGATSPFHTLMTDNIVEYHFTGDAVYLSHYRYSGDGSRSQPELFEDDGLERVSNINPAALTEFRAHYSDPAISEDDLFYYTYGVLHSQQYRETFANDLAKSAARIPMAASLEDFRAFANAGRKLADLHVNYETVEPYPLDEIHASDWNPNAEGAYRVEKMKYAGKRPNLDMSTIIYNAGITLAGIPAEAHDYKLGTRSALDWLIDRYQVRTHSKSGIVNDPNDWADEVGEPRYILDLIKRVTTVSVRTVEIVNGLPELPI